MTRRLSERGFAGLLFLASIALVGWPAGGLLAEEPSAQKTRVLLASDVRWQSLNPNRGDAAPKAGTLWGDQTEDGASGFLVKFVDGFASPPHIHNITYRGVVIAGGLHNDDPDAEPMWMPAGSYWTQPLGEVHITAARGDSVAYVEIQEGPYLVQPPSEAFDTGERPVNVDASNLVWLKASDTSWIEPTKTVSKSEPEITFLWGQPAADQVSGTLVKLPAGFTGKFITTASTFRVVVIRGQLSLSLDDKSENASLVPGSYFGSEGEATHEISADEETIVYVRTKGTFRVAAKD
ncbi:MULTISPECIES: DUF4437 domain-containing protein [Rhodopirellula]|jgi:hypothetical protein|uniref:DUF4437 domain-containing protein n=1 Tax=Rhodopirellula TaxID=265488 RepID=UPI00257A5089|nr:DUF4437 domain-containing protein [Rhodopirellula sp. UBA1907]